MPQWDFDACVCIHMPDPTTIYQDAFHCTGLQGEEHKWLSVMSEHGLGTKISDLVKEKKIMEEPHSILEPGKKEETSLIASIMCQTLNLGARHMTQQAEAACC